MHLVIFVLYFTAWAGVHSLLASHTVKRWVRSKWGADTDRWYRFAYSAFAVLSMLPMFAMLLVFPDQTLYRVPAPWRWLMMAGQALALIGMALTILQTGALQFLGISQLLAGQPRGSGLLQVHGFYCYVRHPLYLFGLIAIWLMPTMTLNLAVAFSLVTLYLVIGSFHEERLLLEEFGEVYRDYQRQVPRLIPRPRRCYANTGRPTPSTNKR